MTAPSRPLSLCWLTVRGAHPLEHLDAARAGGFDAVGLRLVPPQPGDPMVPVVGDEALVREIAARSRGEGIAVLDVETVWIGPDLDVPALSPVFEVARQLGCRHLLTMGNDPDLARFTDTFARLCDAAAPWDVSVGLEFCAYTQVPTIGDAQQVVRAVTRPNARVLVDALHLARSGGTPEDVAALPQHLLAYAQLADAGVAIPSTHGALRDEARGGRLLPGEGGLPLRQLVQALPPGLPLGVEAPTPRLAALPMAERARLAGAALRRLLETIDHG